MIELHRIESVVYEVYVRVKTADKLHVPRRDGSDTIRFAQHPIASVYIDIAIPLAERTRPPLTVRLILRIRHLFIQIAYIHEERQMFLACHLIRSPQGKSGKGGAENEVKALSHNLPLHPGRETAVAVIGEQ